MPRNQENKKTNTASPKKSEAKRANSKELPSAVSNQAPGTIGKDKIVNSAKLNPVAGKSKEAKSAPNAAGAPDAAANDKADASHPLAIVAIGASAGGLAALRSFLSQVPAKSGLAYVIVVHLAPDHKSYLSELLQTHARIPVIQVLGEMPIEPDTAYVIPPNANLNSIDTHLRLSELEHKRGDRAPIDHFFRTLADTHDGEAVAVILTGTGSDGTLGLKHIKEMNGLTVAQDPNEAEFSAMPQNAIATGLVDLILPVSDIPAAIEKYAHTRPRIPQPSEDKAPQSEQQFLHNVLRHVRNRTGRDFSSYKSATIMRRVRRRMQLHHIEDTDAYLELLRTKADECRALAEEFLIIVSSFFRDREVFAHLEKEVIPKLFAGKKSSDTIRVWSVGCATGEEAYSLAILLLEAAARQDDPPSIQVFASDMHEGAIKTAREGFYAGDIQTELSPERISRWFTNAGENYCVRKQLRETVIFTPHNLLSDPPFSRIDLISCRNLFIYLQREAQQNIIRLFHYALNPEGYLLLGVSETAEISELFKTEHKKFCVFRKRKEAPRDASGIFVPVFRPRVEPSPNVQRQPLLLPSLGGLHQKLVERYAPPSVLLDANDGVVHLSEHAGRYLTHPGGEVTSTIFKLVREELRIELRASLAMARKERQPIRSRSIAANIDNQQCLVQLDVRPAEDAENDGFCLVIFDELRPEPKTADAASPLDASPRELESELELTRQRLQETITQYETGQEEMKAANEELQSINEEMRSMMEELETSKEELQSMNEELQTANQENRHRVEEFSQLTADLQSLIAATDIAIIFLDRELRIMRFTPPVKEIFNIRMSDQSRPISDLTHHLGYAELASDAQSVLHRLTPVEREVSDDRGRWFLARMHPYCNTENRIEGVVLTFVDFTKRKRAEDDLRESQEKLQELSRTLEKRIVERTRELEEKSNRLRWLASELATTEQRERKRLAAILHDELQQILTAAHMKIGQVKSKVGEADSFGDLHRVTEMIDMAIASARDLTRQLRPPVLYEVGLLAALRWLGESMAERYALQISLDVPAVEPMLEDDIRALVFECCRELLFNVVKHSGVKECGMQVREGRNALTIVISDSGCGFDCEAAMDETDSFGLFSVRERIAAVGGQANIESRVGDGARIELTVGKAAPVVPRVLPPLPASGRARGRGSEAPDAKGRIGLVVVEDHNLMRQGIVKLLDSDARFKVLAVAEDGLEGVSIVEEWHPQVVLMDVNLPGLNGIEATREIMRRFQDIAVIGLSIQDDEATLAAMREAGAVDFLSKTINAKLLFKAVIDAAASIASSSHQ